MAKYDTQVAKLEEEIGDGTIPETDGDLLTEYVNAKVNEHERGETAETTVKNHVFYLRKLACRMDVNLADASLSDLEDTLKAMNTGTHPDVSDTGIGIGNYQGTARVFYRFHDHLDIDPRDIEIDRTEGRDLSAEDLFFQDDVDGLLNACYGNTRDRAFLALALATGQRLDALRTLRRKHVTVTGKAMDIQLNRKEGDLKGARGKKALLWAKHYVKPWYNDHPFPDSPEAALFVPLPKSVTAREDVDPRDPMHPSSLRRILDNRAALAGITREGGIYPHLLRHTAITRMVQEGYTEQEIKQTVGWSADGGRFGTYNHLASELSNDSIRRKLGYPDTGETVIIGKPTLETCTCGEQYPPTMAQCPTCGLEPGEEKTSPEQIDEMYSGDESGQKELIVKMAEWADLEIET